jgi:hypothetical protein
MGTFRRIIREEMESARAFQNYQPVVRAMRRTANQALHSVNHGEPGSTPSSLPLLDELRTCCYENEIDEIPTLLAI